MDYLDENTVQALTHLYSMGTREDYTFWGLEDEKNSIRATCSPSTYYPLEPLSTQDIQKILADLKRTDIKISHLFCFHRAQVMQLQPCGEEVFDVTNEWIEHDIENYDTPWERNPPATDHFRALYKETFIEVQEVTTDKEFWDVAKKFLCIGLRYPKIIVDRPKKNEWSLEDLESEFGTERFQSFSLETIELLQKSKELLLKYEQQGPEKVDPKEKKAFLEKLKAFLLFYINRFKKDILESNEEKAAFTFSVTSTLDYFKKKALVHGLKFKISKQEFNKELEENKTVPFYHTILFLILEQYISITHFEIHKEEVVSFKIQLAMHPEEIEKKVYLIPKLIEAHGLILNTESKTIRYGNKESTLSPTLFHIALQLFIAPDHKTSLSAIMESTNTQGLPKDNLEPLRTNITRIKKKIPKEAKIEIITEVMGKIPNKPLDWHVILTIQTNT